jgi:16S rRNA (cytosine1402-N4)-methyltransferase
MTDFLHQPVLYQEIIHALEPRSPGLYIDGTVGAGGHARGILEACAPDGRLLGLDIDSQALALARENLAPYGQRATLTQASYTSLPDVMRQFGWQIADGIVLDLGVSSMQLDRSERGFSFQYDGPLDMRFDSGSGLPASHLVNTASEAELTDVLQQYGEEPHAKRIAKMIVEARPITTTTQLAAIAKRAYRQHVRIHPATRTFQALRIAVNDELSTLEHGLPKAIEVLRPGGRLAVISFHSLEDRIVKQFIRSRTRDQLNPPYERIYEVEHRADLKEISPKPLVPTEQEIRRNPRARSAKLRVVEKLRAEPQP